MRQVPDWHQLATNKQTVQLSSPNRIGLLWGVQAQELFSRIWPVLLDSSRIRTEISFQIARHPMEDKNRVVEPMEFPFLWLQTDRHLSPSKIQITRTINKTIFSNNRQPTTQPRSLRKWWTNFWIKSTSWMECECHPKDLLSSLLPRITPTLRTIRQIVKTEQPWRQPRECSRGGEEILGAVFREGVHLRTKWSAKLLRQELEVWVRKSASVVTWVPDPTNKSLEQGEGATRSTQLN